MSIPGSVNPLFLGAAGQATAATGYQIERSVRFNSPDSAYLSRTPASSSNRKTWTWAGWVKRSRLSSTNAGLTLFSAGSGITLNHHIGFASDKFYVSAADGAGTYLITTPLFRDVSAWYHIVVASDTAQATPSNRIKIYINGSEITQFSASTYPSQDYVLSINNNVTHKVGARERAAVDQFFSGYLADVHFIDGQALTPSSFGEFDTNGVWQPIDASGLTFGTNGFHLPFSDNSTAAALGTDTSSNGNTWTVNNISASTGDPTSVAAASGALPIYNTTDTYGTVKGTGTRTDSNSSSIVLAIPMDGTNNGTTFTDESATIKGSGSAKVITRSNAVTTTAQSKFYGSSGSFGLAGNNNISIASSSDFTFGTGNFTIEFYLYVVSSGSNNCIVDLRGNSSIENYFLKLTSSTSYELRFSSSSLASFTAGASQWNHIAISRSGGTTRIYLNGSQAASFADSNNATTNGPVYVSTFADTATSSLSFGFEGYMQDFRVYKGVAKYTSNFNPPSDTANATVAAGNDSLVDSPTSYGTGNSGGEVVGNYATWNPLKTSLTLSNGNLDGSGPGGWYNVAGTIAVTSGKWYWEVTMNTSAYVTIGVATPEASLNETYGTPTSVWVYDGRGTKQGNGSGNAGSSTDTYGASYGAGDVIGVALDMDNGTLTFYKNNTSQGTAFSTGLSGKTITPWHGLFSSTSSANFGQRQWAYAAPAGFKALCTTNLPEPTIADGSTVMDVLTWSGNNASPRSFTGLNFSPDFIWAKCRNASAGHSLFDTVRGTGKELQSQATQAEVTNSIYGYINSFDSNGFTVVAGTEPTYGSGSFNMSGRTYVGWTWDAGSSTVTNTEGSISSQVRANASAGFSVVGFDAGAGGQVTMGHGLGVAPGLIIVKRRTAAESWYVWTQGFTNSEYLILNGTSAKISSTNLWGTSVPSSTLFGYNANAGTHIAYCFAPVAGYSSFGSYTGNGSADGPFVFCNFRPRWILFKRTDSVSSGDWVIYDTSRDPYNVCQNYLLANSSGAEGAFANVDYLSNGFKLKSTGSINTSGGTFIYYAVAESPFQSSRAR